MTKQHANFQGERLFQATKQHLTVKHLYQMQVIKHSTSLFFNHLTVV